MAQTSFAELVRLARRRAGLSQSELARLLTTSGRPEGVWSTYIGQIEKGRKVPSEEICLKLAEILQLDPVSSLVRAHRDRAEHESVRLYLDQLLAAISAWGLSALNEHEENLPSPPEPTAVPEEAVPFEDLLDVIQKDLLTNILPALPAVGSLKNLCHLMQDMEHIHDSEWAWLWRLLGQHFGRQD